MKTTWPDVRFLIVGDHNLDDQHFAQFGQLKALMRETGTEDLVYFHGFEPDMARFYGAIDCLVLPTHSEGFPLVILEAMSFGKPVVATDLPGIAEAVVDGITGSLVPDADAPRLAAALLTIAENPSLAENMGASGRTRASEYFGPERYDREVVDIYSRFLSRKR
jgi:glycosyltransferase involved in cell wall biosynthesis